MCDVRCASKSKSKAMAGAMALVDIASSLCCGSIPNLQSARAIASSRLRAGVGVTRCASVVNNDCTRTRCLPRTPSRGLPRERRRAIDVGLPVRKQLLAGRPSNKSNNQIKEPWLLWGDRSRVRSSSAAQASIDATNPTRLNPTRYSLVRKQS